MTEEKISKMINKEIAKPLYYQQLERSLDIQPFLSYVENLFKQPIRDDEGSSDSDAKTDPNFSYSQWDRMHSTKQDETLCANTVIFLVAGSESSSSTTMFCLYELSRNQEAQRQEEVDAVLNHHDGQWSYKAIKEMTYLDQVVQESQRMHPIIPFLQRECTKTYTVSETNLVIEKGILDFIPVPGIHKDPDNYPDPEEFRPERFENNNFKSNAAFLPFGEGPRICIVMRFAILKVKTAMARIMSKYTVTLSEKTKLPLRLNPRSLIPTVEGGLWLNFEKRSN